MASAKVLVGVILAVVVGIIFMPAAVSAVDTSTGTQTVTNETVTAQTGEYVDLDGYELVDGTVTVYGYDDANSTYETAVDGTDYEVKLQPGQLQALNTSNLIEDGEEVKVSYDYQASGSMTTLVVGFVPLMIGVLLFVVLAKKTDNMLG